MTTKIMEKKASDLSMNAAVSSVTNGRKMSKKSLTMPDTVLIFCCLQDLNLSVILPEILSPSMFTPEI